MPSIRQRADTATERLSGLLDIRPDLTAADVAAAIGVSSGTIYRWIWGPSLPRSRIVINALERWLDTQEN